MSNDTATNIHELPRTDIPTSEDDYERENRKLLVDIDKEEANDPEAKNNNQGIIVGITVLVVLMTISYFGYEYYQNQQIKDSAAAAAAIESTTVEPGTTTSPEQNTEVSNTTPPATPSTETVATQTPSPASASPGQDLLSLIDTGGATVDELNVEPVTNTTPESTQATVEPTSALPAPTQVAPTATQAPGTIVVPDAVLTQLQTTIDQLVTLTGELKTSMSELTFEVDQNSARIAQANSNIAAAMARIEKMEKGGTNRTATTTSKAKPKASPTKQTAPISAASWIDQSSVISVRKIGTSFIAKLRTPSGTKRLSVGDEHQRWVVKHIDLNNGAVVLQHHNGQQRSLSL